MCHKNFNIENYIDSRMIQVSFYKVQGKLEETVSILQEILFSPRETHLTYYQKLKGCR